MSIRPFSFRTAGAGSRIFWSASTGRPRWAPGANRSWQPERPALRETGTLRVRRVSPRSPAGEPARAEARGCKLWNLPEPDRGEAVGAVHMGEEAEVACRVERH